MPTNAGVTASTASPPRSHRRCSRVHSLMRPPSGRRKVRLHWFGGKVHFAMTRVDQFAVPELLVSVERGANGSLRGQIEHELRHAVRSGRLRAGTPLPSTRVLARQLGVARGVVVEAYAQLAAEGYLKTRQGAPTRVAPVATRPRPERRRAETPPPPRYDLRASVPDL